MPLSKRGRRKIGIAPIDEACPNVPGGRDLCRGVGALRKAGGQPGTLRMLRMPVAGGGQLWRAAPRRAAVGGNRVGSREDTSSQEAILSRADSRDSWRCTSDAQPRGVSVSDADGPLAMHTWMHSRGASRSATPTGL